MTMVKGGSLADGMQSFDQSLVSWCSRGVISYENALFYATNPAECTLRIEGGGGTSDAHSDGFPQGSSAT